MQGQMADAPAVLAEYLFFRRVWEEHGTLDARTRSAVMAVAAATFNVEYVVALTSMLAVRDGWTPEEVTKLCRGLGSGDPKLDSLLDVVTDAVGNSGRVNQVTWERAIRDGWTTEQLAESFACLAITVHFAYFCNFAETEVDVPSISVS
jgi:alkylhydroperoxidase/carboxymuconolactone decarboxylase family protein YurZ